MSLNLIVETPAPKEEFEYIVEEGNSKDKQNFFIKGPYMMAEGVNRNKRIYPLDEMVRETKRYEDSMVKTGRAMGELNHPTTADVDLERACHLVTEMTQDGNVFYGKSKVLSTPTGLIVRSLINDGVRVGMSSRALGQLIPESGSEGVNRVKDFKLVEGYLIFDDLTLRDESGNASKIPDGDSLNANRTIDIKTPSGVMKLFATT